MSPLPNPLPLFGRGTANRGLGSLVSTLFVCFCSLGSLHVQCPGVCKCWLGEIANAGSPACFSNTLQRYDGVKARLLLIAGFCRLLQVIDLRLTKFFDNAGYLRRGESSLPPFGKGAETGIQTQPRHPPFGLVVFPELHRREAAFANLVHIGLHIVQCGRNK